MIKLAKHLWDQLVNDEDAALRWWSAFKTMLVAQAAQLALMTGGDLAKLQAWTRWQWLGSVVATLIAGGASAKSSTGTPKP